MPCERLSRQHFLSLLLAPKLRQKFPREATFFMRPRATGGKKGSIGSSRNFEDVGESHFAVYFVLRLLRMNSSHIPMYSEHRVELKLEIIVGTRGKKKSLHTKQTTKKRVFFVYCFHFLHKCIFIQQCYIISSVRASVAGMPLTFSFSSLALSDVLNQ